MFELIAFDPKIMGRYGTLLVGAPFVTTRPVYMYLVVFGQL